ncbi:hypothetical protein ACWF94_27830, partial [Streptomyces sp. NPDC055078]
MASGNPPPGHRGWPPPSAPKPGVIPLRPLGLGDVLGGAFATIGRCWKPLLGIAVTVYAAAGVVIVAAMGVTYALMSDDIERSYAADTPDSGWDEVRPLIVALVVVWAVAALALLGASAMLHAACPAILREAVLGRPVTYRMVRRLAWARLPAMTGTIVLTALIWLIPVGLFLTGFTALLVELLTDDGKVVALIPGTLLGAIVTAPLGIWLWVRFAFAPAAVVFENRGPVDAMSRSWQLVRGDWWRIFGITLLAGCMAAFAAYVVQLPVQAAGMLPGALNSGLGPDSTDAQVLLSLGGLLIVSILSQLIGQLVITTFPPLVTALLYVD